MSLCFFFAFTLVEYRQSFVDVCKGNAASGCWTALMLTLRHTEDAYPNSEKENSPLTGVNFHPVSRLNRQVYHL